MGNVTTYLLPHEVTITINAAKSEKIVNLKPEVSQNDSNFILCDKGNLMVLFGKTI